MKSQLPFALLGTILLSQHSCVATTYSVLTSGYSDDLWTYTLDTDAVTLTQTDSQKWGDGITWMEGDEDIKGTGYNLYAGHEVDSYEEYEETGVVSRWMFDGTDFIRQEYKPLNSVGPAHVTALYLPEVSTSYLLTSNYGGSTFVVHSLNDTDGSILDIVYEEHYGPGSNVDPNRQEMSHPHQAATFGKYIYVMDLGGDRVMVYEAGTNGHIIKIQNWETGPGAGPRHMVINQETGVAYLLNELRMSIYVLQINPTTGLIDTVLDEYYYEIGSYTGEQKGSEIAFHPNGLWLYISHRGKGSVILFEIDPTPGVYLVELEALFTAGPNPRHFAISPDGLTLICADQDMEVLELFSIDQTYGFLAKASEIPSSPQAAIVVITEEVF